MRGLHRFCATFTHFVGTSEGTRMHCRSATAGASDSILVELDGEQHSSFYTRLLFQLLLKDKIA